MSPPLRLAAAVADALAAGRPVVALESTVVAHGLPWPDNLACARAMATAVEAAGALPAPVAVLDGRLAVGLSPAELERLARNGGAFAKAGRRDLPALMARGESGATTVSATLAIAALAGIRLFATGGIGGVHRGGEASFDISADLHALAQSPVCVVSAGAKSILDLPRTLELLETLSVPVAGYRSDAFPAFYCRDSGLEAPARLDSADQAAAFLAAHWHLPGAGGALIANPIPEAAALPRDDVEAWIDRALDEAARKGVAGKAVTPFLLTRLAALSEGRTLAANKALLVANAGLAGEIACAWTRSRAG